MAQTAIRTAECAAPLFYTLKPYIAKRCKMLSGALIIQAAKRKKIRQKTLGEKTSCTCAGLWPRPS